MWLVSNKTNSSFLDKFAEKIIRPFFELVIEASFQRNRSAASFPEFKRKILSKLAYYKNMEDEDKLVIDYIFSVRKDYKYFYQVFLNLLRKYSGTRLTRLYYIYKTQNVMISQNGDYNIREFEVDDDFRIIFIKFFYDRFFNEDRIWMQIAGEQYSKRIFHKNFHEENDNITVCPYCDMSNTLADSSNYVEHFLPKDKFPFLAMCPMNLISSCDACNKGADGKGESVISPVVTPYGVQIGELLKFEADVDFQNISVTNLRSKIEITNFLGLLQIVKRYNQEKTRSHLEKEVTIQIDTLHRFGITSNLSKADIDNYLSLRDKHSPLNLATKSIVRDIFF